MAIDQRAMAPVLIIPPLSVGSVDMGYELAPAPVATTDRVPRTPAKWDEDSVWTEIFSIVSEFVRIRKAKTNRNPVETKEAVLKLYLDLAQCPTM